MLDRTNLNTPGAKVKPDIEALFDAVDTIEAAGNSQTFTPVDYSTIGDNIEIATLNASINPGNADPGVHTVVTVDFPNITDADRLLIGFFNSWADDSDIKSLRKSSQGAFHAQLFFHGGDSFMAGRKVINRSYARIFMLLIINDINPKLSQYPYHQICCISQNCGERGNNLKYQKVR